MIRLNGKTGAISPSPWRRRISNQLAAFAAVMLFASTQVGVPEGSAGADSGGSNIASQQALSDLNGPQLEIKTTLDQATGNSTKKTSRSKKSKRFELNLFRFRR